MNFLSILLIALGLSMDAFAVSIASGLAIKPMRIRQALRIAAFFGLFQSLMPVIGWLAGLSLRAFISGMDHWLAFGLLVLIGGKMMIESLQLKGADQNAGPMSLYILLLLSVATSVDALAVGLSLSLLKVFIVAPALLIGVVTFGLSWAGVLIGNRAGHFFERKVEAIGGLILIGIGIKILLDHLG